MKKALVSLISLVLATSLASAFGGREHRAIAIIAENHLTPQAAAAISEITGGERLAVLASHPDRFRSYYFIDGEKIRHSFAVDGDMQLQQEGNDPISAIEIGVKALSGKNYKKISSSDSAQLLLSYVVHFVGDMHCPGHVRYPKEMTPKAPKTYTIRGIDKKFHETWDSGFLSGAFGSGSLDLVYFADVASDKEIGEIQKGDIHEWAGEIAKSCCSITRDGEIDENGTVVCDPYFTELHAMFAKRQIMKAGYRLAAVLNRMFAE